MKSLIMLVFGCLFTLTTSAQNLPLLPSRNYTADNFPESKASSKKMEVITIKEDTSQLTYVHNVKYVTRNGMDLTLQIIQPKSANKKLPCIVYVQGSAWMKQNVYANIPQLIEFAKRGYVIAIVEYRPSSVAPFPAQIQDAKTAIRFMRENANTYHVDADNVFIWGDSSGGHTALMVGLTANNTELDTDDLKEYATKVNAVVDFYGPTDITKMNEEPSILDHVSPGSPEGQLLGGKNVLENKAEAARTNPVTYVKDTSQAKVPILIIHGSKDKIVPFHQSVLMADALERNNYPYKFYQIKGADHGSSEFWTKETFDLVERFLKPYVVKN